MIEGSNTDLLASGVESKIMDASPSGRTVGLLGQKGSPMVNTRRVAALTHNNLNILQETATDAPNGSIGQWTTIIEPPSAEKASRETASKKQENFPEPLKFSSERRKARSRAPSILEQSVSRNAKNPATRIASASRSFSNSFWEQVSLGGN